MNLVVGSHGLPQATTADRRIDRHGQARSQAFPLSQSTDQSGVESFQPQHDISHRFAREFDHSNAVRQRSQRCRNEDLGHTSLVKEFHVRSEIAGQDGL